MSKLKIIGIISMSIFIIFLALIMGINFNSKPENSTKDVSCQSSSLVIIDKDGSLNSNIQEILKITGIENVNSLEELVKKTQDPLSHWMRPRGKERWEFEDFFSNKKSELLPIFKNLGLMDPILPQKKSYDIAIVTGGLAESFVVRLETLNELLAQNKIDSKDLKEVVVLTGQRFVDQKQDMEYLKEKFKDNKWQENLNKIKTETDIAEFLIHETDLFKELTKNKVTIVDTPGTTNSEGQYARPTTETTIKFWLKNYNPVYKNLIAISSQPFVKYQHSVLLTFLPDNFNLETVGLLDPREEYDSPKLHLDNLARIFYQENIRLKSKR